MTVVLIVLGVIIAVLVIPSMSGMVARHRVQGVQAELLGDLQLARSEQAQRNGTSTSVAVSFGSNEAVTCYTIHTVGGALCDCTRAPGTACTGVADAQEIKTMQFERAVGVSVAASSPGGGSLVFAPPKGLVTPADVVIDVQSATRGQLRTSISATGVPSVCSPDGSILGVRTC
ncbi:MAG TPA: hypothetical protein VFU71_22050 [Burkholderiaceae bacterium]|nr:hypothetical protein [Burkholderiaceae bacterium]